MKYFNLYFVLRYVLHDDILFIFMPMVHNKYCLHANNNGQCPYMLGSVRFPTKRGLSFKSFCISVKVNLLNVFSKSKGEELVLRHAYLKYSYLKKKHYCFP